jgi:hypothetical protein
MRVGVENVVFDSLSNAVVSAVIRPTAAMVPATAAVTQSTAAVIPPHGGKERSDGRHAPSDDARGPDPWVPRVH